MFPLLPILLFGGLITVIVSSEVMLRRAGFRARRAPPGRRTPHQFGTDAFGRTGGARVGWTNATVPFVRLTADRDWANLSGPLISVWLDRNAVTRVRRIRALPVIAEGIMFDSADGRFDGVVFWSLSSSEVLAGMASLEWNAM